MSEFKYACPVCGQHIKCDSSQSGSVMECPTCFQKITVPQAPATNDPKFIITGTKVGERPVPAAADAGPAAVREKHVPLGIFAIVFLVCAAVAAVFVAREMKTKHATMQSDTADGLTLRTAVFPPVAGITVYLRPNPIESVYGKSLLFEPNMPGAPPVYLRWRNAQGQETDDVQATGYALRIEFGNPASNYIPGKIYLCTPDELKSYVVGSFNAEIVQPPPR